MRRRSLRQMWRAIHDGSDGRLDGSAEVHSIVQVLERNAMRYSYTSTRRDANQKKIIEAYESVGASVQDLSSIGGGCVDLLVGYKRVNYCIEVKNLERKGGPNNRVDTLGKQLKWRAEWNGTSCVVGTVEEALRAIGVETFVRTGPRAMIADG